MRTEPFLGGLVQANRRTLAGDRSVVADTGDDEQRPDALPAMFDEFEPEHIATAKPQPEPIGQVLLKRNLISEQDLAKALAAQGQVGGRLGAMLVRIGAISEDTLLPTLAEQLGVDLLTKDTFPESLAAISRAVESSGLSPDWFFDQHMVVWEGADGQIHCGSVNPLSNFQLEVIESAFPQAQPQQWYLAKTQDVEVLLRSVADERNGAGGDDVAQLKEMAEEIPVIEQVNDTISQAIDADASDIHLEPEADTFVIRYRIDGVLHNKQQLPKDRYQAISTRIKLISGMDIAERRLPQDGRIAIRASGVDMDIRVSALPGVHGESIVLRLLPKNRSDLKLSSLGIEPDLLAVLNAWLGAPHGIVLVTGPTGSGKSTTLYSMLGHTDTKHRKVITVEDPVEYRMAGVTQVQAHSDIGYDFARALRAILRQDPDIIMIGEIRDGETANIAVQAALTGHLVLSTLHTNNALGAFNRLIDMGVEPFLVASAVTGVIAQRLVRRLCVDCARSAEAPDWVEGQLLELHRQQPGIISSPPTWRQPSGCPRCQGTGFRGRVGIYEYAGLDGAMQGAIVRRATTSEMIQLARPLGYRTLREDGLLKARSGVTSLDEVLRVTGGDDR